MISLIAVDFVIICLVNFSLQGDFNDETEQAEKPTGR